MKTENIEQVLLSESQAGQKVAPLAPVHAGTRPPGQLVAAGRGGRQSP